MFDATQYATLRLAIDRMIPVDDAPGGLDAGVDRYIMHFLQHDGAGFSTQYESALTALFHEAHIRYGRAFAELSPEQADAVLYDVQHNHTRVDWPWPASAFVAMLAEHCAEGFYADPRQGGNAHEVSWRMIGFEERR